MKERENERERERKRERVKERESVCVRETLDCLASRLNIFGRNPDRRTKNSSETIF
jgi:hypothetical protein